MLNIIELPVLPSPELSPNAWDRASRPVRIRRLHEEREMWLAHLHAACGPPREQPLGYPVDITFSLCGTGRRTDKGNWVAHRSLKLLLDCLTQPTGAKPYGMGVLRDDGWDCVEEVTVRCQPHGEPRTSIIFDIARSQDEAQK